MFCRGSTVCVGCKGPVGEMEGKCSGCEKVQEVDISKEKVFFFESLEDSQVLKAYQVLRSKIHIYDYKMVEFSERAMAVCLAEENYEKFYQIGESLLTAYKLYFSPNSTSLGLHLGKLAKVAIFLNQTEDAILYLKQCFDIFKLSHGEDSKMYHYLITIRDTT